MPTPAKILELVDRFRRNYSAYSDALYKETRLRVEFLDPFFRELGWDVNNEQGFAEDYKDVVHEESLKLGEASESPDYSFRIGGTRKFFVEAKKPSVDVGSDIQPAYQLRRYAWSAKLPLSVLTDFEEFAVYDCRVTPHKADKASRARILLLNFTDYPEKWPEIATIFSREAVLKGSFDTYAESSKAMRGTAEVDLAFLKDIEQWRDTLARNIALRNPTLSQEELNFAVQQTIDRIVFMRICEDRGIEPYARLRDAVGASGAYSELVRLFRQADDRYNSGLFHFRSEPGRPSFSLDKLTPNLEIDDRILVDIIKNLYYPDSSYEFSVFPPEILGQVYEQFLGKVIRLTAGHHAVVEEKPEVKKSGGVFYTPSNIVGHIVAKTLDPVLAAHQVSPRASAGAVTVLDPACGSGSFLLGAYQHLLDWHKRKYIDGGPEKWAKGSAPRLRRLPNGEWRLTTLERKRILLASVYGVDIDPQAVEVTKLSLLLKVLEGENQASLATQLSFIQERVLPDLANNIKCGNSLIGPDYFQKVPPALLSEEDAASVKPFDWDNEFPTVMGAGGFHVIIGNPPYDVMEKQRGKASWPHEALAQYIHVTPDYAHALGGKLNLFRFFMVRSLQLLRSSGRFGMIVPLAILADITSARARKHLLLTLSQLAADCFPQKDNPRKRVFVAAKLSTVIVTGELAKKVSPSQARIDVRVYPANSLSDTPKHNIVTFADATLLDPETTPIPLVDSREWRVCKHIHTRPRVIRLGTSPDYVISRGEINQTIYRQFISSDARRTRLLKGVEVGQYQVHGKLSQGSREWFDEKAFLASNSPKPVVALRRIATQRITGVDERLRIVATIIAPKTYFADSTNSIAGAPGAAHSLEYLLGILNSSLIQWRFKITSTNNNVGTNELEALPFRIMDHDDPQDFALYTELSSLVLKLMKLHSETPPGQGPIASSVMAGHVDATSKAIDDIVYALFDVSPRDREMIELSLESGHAPASRSQSA